MLLLASLASSAIVGRRPVPAKTLEPHQVGGATYRSTGLLLNWKRPHHVERVIQNLKGQSHIWVWNNGVSGNFKDVDVQINSSVNFLSYPRWLMATQARTEFVFVHDDDLMITTPIAQLEAYMETLPEDAIIGVEGVELVPGRGYWTSKHYAVKDFGKVDIVKGRFMFLRSKLLEKVFLKPGPLTRGDDIYVSSFSTFKELPKFVRIKELPVGGEGLMYQKGHGKEREKALQLYFFRDKQVK